MTGSIAEIIKWLGNQDKTKKFTIKQYREKRSLNANSYYWKLISQIASILHTSKEEVHTTMIKRYSNRDEINILSSIDISKYTDYYDKIRTYEFNNKQYTSYLIYTGSSKMNSKEMYILIEGVVSEAKEMGIETLTPDELAKLEYIENVSNSQM